MKPGAASTQVHPGGRRGVRRDMRPARGWQGNSRGCIHRLPLLEPQYAAPRACRLYRPYAQAFASTVRSRTDSRRASRVASVVDNPKARRMARFDPWRCASRPCRWPCWPAGTLPPSPDAAPRSSKAVPSKARAGPSPHSKRARCSTGSRLAARTSIFDRHLALEKEIVGSPLMVGNKVILLQADRPPSRPCSMRSVRAQPHPPGDLHHRG